MLGVAVVTTGVPSHLGCGLSCPAHCRGFPLGLWFVVPGSLSGLALQGRCVGRQHPRFYLADLLNRCRICYAGPFCRYGSEDHPAASCQEFNNHTQASGRSLENGYYWLLVDGAAAQRYCDLARGGIEVDTGETRTSNNPATCAALWAAVAAGKSKAKGRAKDCGEKRSHDP